MSKFEGPFASDVFLAICISMVALLILRRRQRRHGLRVSNARLATTFLVAALTAFACVRLLPMMLSWLGARPSKWIAQATQIASALVAYLIAARAMVVRVPRS